MVRTCSILVNIMVKLSTERRFPPDVQGSHRVEERRKPPAPAWRTREGAPCAERAARAPKSLENALTFKTTCLQFSQCATRGWASPPPPGPAPTSPHHWGQTSLLGGTTHCPRGNWLFTLVMLPAPESLARSLAADNNTSVMHPCCPSWPAGVSRSPCRRPPQGGSRPPPGSSECTQLLPWHHTDLSIPPSLALPTLPIRSPH